MTQNCQLSLSAGVLYITNQARLPLGEIRRPSEPSPLVLEESKYSRDLSEGRNFLIDAAVNLILGIVFSTTEKVCNYFATFFVAISRNTRVLLGIKYSVWWAESQ